jgi:tetratricopeptide (TPR) repeat protein
VIQDRRQPSEEALRLLEVGLAGQPIDLDVADGAAGIEAGEQAALAVLRGARLVRLRSTRSQDQVEVYHDRLRDTVLARLSAEALTECHRRLAIALQASGRADAEMLADHYEGAGDLERAAEHAAAAAARASEALAFDRAAHLYRRAVGLRAKGSPEWRAAAAGLGDALASAGRGTEAAAAYLSAVIGARPAEFVELHRRAAQQLLISGHVDEGLRVLNTVLGRLGMSLPSTPRRTLLSLLTRRAWLRLRGIGFRERDESQVSNGSARIDIRWSAAAASPAHTIRGADFAGATCPRPPRGQAAACGPWPGHRVAPGRPTTALCAGSPSGRSPRPSASVTRTPSPWSPS